MKYKFETIKKDYSDFSSGRVLYNAANTTAFPVRLASEVISVKHRCGCLFACPATWDLDGGEDIRRMRQECYFSFLYTEQTITEVY